MISNFRVVTFWGCNNFFPVDCAISQGQNSPSASLVINSIVMRLRKRVFPTWAPTTWKSWTSRRNLSRSSPRSTMHFWLPSLLSSKFPGFWDLVLTRLANSHLCLVTETTLMKRSKTCRAPYLKFQMKKVLCLNVAIGNLEMDEDQLVQNIPLFINFLRLSPKKASVLDTLTPKQVNFYYFLNYIFGNLRKTNELSSDFDKTWPNWYLFSSFSSANLWQNLLFFFHQLWQSSTSFYFMKLYTNALKRSILSSWWRFDAKSNYLVIDKKMVS